MILGPKHILDGVTTYNFKQTEKRCLDRYTSYWAYDPLMHHETKGPKIWRVYTRKAKSAKGE